MSRVNTISPGVSGYDFDDGAILFVEHTRELLRLNPTGAVIWHGLRAGLPFQEIVSSLVHVTGTPAVAIEQDVAALINDLEGVGVLQANRLIRRSNSSITGERYPTQKEPARPYQGSHVRDHKSAEHSYQLVDFRFRLRTPPGSIASEAARLFSHVHLSDKSGSSVVVELMEDGNEWLLLYDDVLVDRCSSSGAVIPMLHANVLLTAYRTSGCMAALHAAAVIRNDTCVLMPGASGSGKTTLTAAAVAYGFQYCSDDLTLLTHEPVRIRPVSTCLGLKSGSWNVLAGLFPQIHELPIHVRIDGKKIRYLPPGAGIAQTPASYAVTRLVFPVWTPGSAPACRKIGTAEALERLTASGYDLPNRINSEVVAGLIRYISQMQCFELRYDSTQDAVRTLSILCDQTTVAGPVSISTFDLFRNEPKRDIRDKS